MERQTKKLLRSPMPKKRSKTVPLSERITLERVLGVTVKDDSALTCDPNTGLIAYPAGCVIVIFNPRNNKQTHICNHSKKTITALAFSPDGRNLVSGECGHNPAVRVWDVEDRSQVAELQGHKFGVSCVAFSPNLRYVVSIGEQHDMAVNVWNWKDGAKVCHGKISNKVTGLCFSEDGNMFVTVGNRNVKFWYLSAKSRIRETIPLNGRSGILGEQRNNFFCSVACGKGKNARKTYCITKSGLLCEFNDSRLLDKWVELKADSKNLRNCCRLPNYKMRKIRKVLSETNIIWTDCHESPQQETINAYCLSASEHYLFVGCADGVLRVFNASTLHFVATFPKPHFLGVNVSDGIDSSHMVAHQENAKYPDAIAVVHDDVNKKVTCIYNDHSVYVWDVHDVKKIGKHWSFLYHSSCIWGVEVYPKMLDGIREMLPPESFITCSSDDTIRIWNTDPAMTSDLFKRNIYSKELLKILYIDKKFENLLDVDYNPAGTSDKTDPGEGNNGVRCLCVSPDGQHLASGDRSGNVRVHDLQFMDELHCIEAHDSEVLCLEYTQPETGYNLLASASRDRLIHIFNMDEECSLLQTLDDHSSSITAVKFTYTNAQLQMISCGADKALMFRSAVQNPDFEFVRNHHVVGKQTLYDIAIDPTKKFVATACQDRNLRIHNTSTGKLKRIYKGSHSDDGTLIKVELDPSGMYVATSCSDKTLAVFDFYSGECVATMAGHSELVTGIKFSSDCKHLISASGDGCIFLWQLPWGITHNMKERLAEMGQVKRRQEREYDMLRRGTYVVPQADMPLRIRSQIRAASQSTRNNNNNTEEQQQQLDIDESQFRSATEQLKDELDKQMMDKQRESTVPEDYRFSIGQLPTWAKKQVSGEKIPSPSTYSSPSQPKGRWAQRIDSQGIKVKSEWENTIEVRLEDCLDRRRYTVEPDALLDQVRILSHLPYWAIFNDLCPLPENLIPEEFNFHGKDFPVSEEDFQDEDDNEFVSAEEGLKTFERELSQAEMEKLAQSFVTDTRGSDPFLPPRPCSSAEIISPLSQEDEQSASQDEDAIDGEEETSSSAKEEENKEEDIIYPPSDETPSSPENLNFEITASTKSFEEHARRKRSREENRESMSMEKKSSDTTPLTSPDSEVAEPTSTDDDEDGIEDDSLEDEEEEESLPSTTESKADSLTSSTSPDHDEEEFLHTNFNFLEKEKFGLCLEQLQSGFTDDIATGRLSISSKFLSRAQMSQPKGPVIGVHGLAAASGGISAEQYLLRRKQEMAMAVDKTRRRLQMLGWKKSDSSKKLVSASSLDGSSKSSQKNQKQRTASSSDTKSTASDKASTTSTSSAKDSDSNELDRADSLEDIIDSPSESSEHNTAPATGGSPSKSRTSPAAGAASSSRKPPVVPPKPRGRKKTSNRSSEGDTQGTSSSGEDVSRSDDSLNAKDETPSLEESKPRKKELPQIPVAAKAPSPVKGTSPMKPTGHELSPEQLQKMKAEQDNTADEDNVVFTTHEVRRSSCGAAKAKINRIKNKKERDAVMRRAASMSELGADTAEEKDSSPSTHTMTLRSRSSERPAVMRSVPNSPAREKRRARNERIVPLLPNQQQKLKSYEIGTTSSRAKLHPRVDTPPSSPHHKYNKKKRNLLSELKDSKEKTNTAKVVNSKESSKTVENKTNGANFVRNKSVDDTNIPETKPESDPCSRDSLETDDDKLKKSSVKVKEEADRLAMPPPTLIRIGKAKNAQKPSAEQSRVGAERKETASADTSGDDNGAQSLELVKNSEIKLDDPPNVTEDQPMISPSSESSSEPMAINGHDVALNGHDSAINGHDVDSQESSTSSDVSPMSGHDNERTISGGSPLLSTCDSIPDDILTDDATEASEPSESANVPSVSIVEDAKKKMSLDLPSPTKEPMPSKEIVTPEELRTGVDQMKQAFDSCMELFTKATSPDTSPDISKGHYMLDYLSSTLNSMQNKVARLQSDRRRFYSFTSQESLLTASSASLTSLQEHHRDRTASAGCLPDLRKSSSSSLSQSDLQHLKTNLGRVKKPGNGKSREDDTEAASALVLLDQYSEMLVSMFRDKIVEDKILTEEMLGQSKGPPFASDV